MSDAEIIRTLAEKKQSVLNLYSCSFCGCPSELLCDYVLGFACAGKTEDDRPEIPKYAKRPSRRLIGSDSDMFTCDVPFCRNCGRCGIETIFTCGSGCSVDTVDHCRIHADMPHRGNGITPMYPAEVEVVRKQIRIAISKFRLTAIAALGDAQPAADGKETA